jgi:hypothetical protein
MRRRWLITCTAAALLGAGAVRVRAQAPAPAPVGIAEVETVAFAAQDIVLVSGTVHLPSAGFWVAADPDLAAGSVRQVRLQPPKELLRARYGTGRGRPPSDGAEAAVPAVVEYEILGLLADRNATLAETRIRNTETDEVRVCRWTLDPQQPPETGAAHLLQDWHRGRAYGWFSAAGGTYAPVLDAWCRAFGGQSPFDEQSDRANRRQGPAPETAMGVLGGRAAIRETLQLEALRLAGQPAPDTAPSVPLAEIKGVEVKSHPYAEMLDGSAGGRLRLAECAPADRAFVYVARPAALAGFLDGGAGFLHEFGMLQTGNAARYDLANRSLARLGLSRAWLDAALRSGAIAELALVLPDLFLIDGTDLTVIARVPRRQLLLPVLALAGVVPARDGLVLVRQAGAQPPAYWATTGELLVAGTNRGEVERVLALTADPNGASLGRSAEFRYMLTQLAPGPGTQAFVYLSDTFIRRLTGPEVKIGQYRRLQARAALEELTAAAMLYQYDAHPEAPTLDTLLRHGYLSGAADAPPWAGCTLRPDGVAESATWGTLAQPRTLLETPLTAATPAEAAAYAAYVENYSRYWRQYFDPIALRLDETVDGALELTAFILPLLDNSLYNGLREALAGEPVPTPLRIPQLDPPGVVTLSVRLPPAARQELVRNAGPAVAAQTGLNPRLFAFVGPGVHLAVRDSDPVLAFGSGDLAGAFGALGLLEGGRGGQMLFIPVLASILTRPCALLVELTDPPAVRELLRRGTVPGPSRQREFKATLTQYPERDAWLYSLDLFGVAQLRFGLEICGDYLVITNVPWSQQVGLREPLASPQTVARLALAPGAVQQQLPALFTATAGRERATALQGLGALLPFLLCGAPDPAAAAAQHAYRFGFTPEHPGGGQWLWEDGRLASDRYGRPGRLLEPSWRPGDRDFGLLRRVSEVAVSMQFEGAGLRAACRWRPVPPPKPAPAP